MTPRAPIVIARKETLPTFYDVAAVLNFEALHGTSAAVEHEIRRTFQVTPTRYYQRLSQLIHTREALEHDPVLVHRLLQLEQQREDARETRLREANR